MTTVFIKVMVIFAMIAAGFVANRVGVLPKESSKYLSALLVDVTTPCLALSSIASQEMTRETWRASSEVVIGSVIYFIVAAVIAYIFVRMLRYEPAQDRGVLAVTITSANTGFMGFPVSKAIFGDKIFFLFIIQNIILNIYIYSGAIVQMNQGNAKEISLSKLAKAMVNPCMCATAVGIFLMVTGTRMPAPMMDFFKTMGDSTIPISMIVVGLQLGSSDLKAVFKNTKLTLASLANVILMPLLTLIAVWFLPITDASKLTLIFAAAFPSAVLPVAIAEMEHKNAALMSQGVSLTTLMSMVTLPAWAILLMHLFTY